MADRVKWDNFQRGRYDAAMLIIEDARVGALNARELSFVRDCIAAGGLFGGYPSISPRQFQWLRDMSQEIKDGKR